MAAAAALGLLEYAGLLSETVAATVIESATAPSGIAAATTAIGAGSVIANLPSRKGKTAKGIANYSNPRTYQSAFQTPQTITHGVAGPSISPGNALSQSAGIRRSINFHSPNKETAVQEPREVTPVANNQATAQSATAMATGNDHEVPIAKVPRLISKIHPDVFNIRLPFFTRCEIPNGSVEDGNPNPLCLIRLNSIYDVFKNTHTQEKFQVNPYPTLGTIAATAANANDPIANAITATADPIINTINEGPVGRNLWQGHFKYYRVLRSDVKLTFINTNCERQNDGEKALPNYASINGFHNMYAIGYELIDEDSMLCQNLTAFMTAKGVVRDILMPATGGDISSVTTTDQFATCAKPSVGVMQYTYHPANWNQHVEQQGVETRWTAIGSNPALDHLLAPRAIHMDSDDQYWTAFPGISLLVQIEYEVQFRECLDSFIKEGYQVPSSST